MNRSFFNVIPGGFGGRRRHGAQQRNSKSGNADDAAFRWAMPRRS